MRPQLRINGYFHAKTARHYHSREGAPSRARWIVTFSRKPAFGYRTEGGLLADLRRFDHRIPEQAYSKGACGLCEIALDIAQAK